jgi:hypothetical protein
VCAAAGVIALSTTGLASDEAPTSAHDHGSAVEVERIVGPVVGLAPAVRGRSVSSDHTSMDHTTSEPTSTKPVIVPDDPGIDYVTPDKAPTTKPWEIGWAVGCSYSHSAKDDPIVFPGQPGLSHLHDFFGNTVTDAFSDAQDLRAGTSLCTTVDDMSAYWVPALYVNGVKKQPHSTTFYYEAGVADRTSIVPMPYGLEMIAGNARATGPQNPYIFWFEEKGNVRNNTSDGQMIRAESGEIFARITFPDCWDGKRLSSSDQSHVAYHTNNDTCPASHPVAIPRLRMFITYDTDGAGVSLSSGPWYTMHADFFNAWTPATQKRLVQECIVPSVRCLRVFDVERRWIPTSTTMMMDN